MLLMNACFCLHISFLYVLAQYIVVRFDESVEVAHPPFYASDVVFHNNLTFTIL